MDYETNRSFNDVGVYWTVDATGELCACLRTVERRPEVARVHLTDLVGNDHDRDTTVSLDKRVSLI
ncbi:MAG: hypothetical protein P4L46_03330 [Fimbriimonas sp.]|nr:hypothetical protein [Fimbriimonas sp.]